MRTRYWTFVLAGCTVMAPLSCARAQQREPSPVRSTAVGVYTGAQATEGGDIYGARCRSCHTQAAHALTFQNTWMGRMLAEPFEYIMVSMPKDSPGALSAGETASVLAYFLQLIGNPAGAQALPASLEALSSFRIDTASTQSTHAVEEKKP